ncbi:MAG: TetR/AcrR family transcriptional regulator [Gammaproteobacteria bacterium]
MPRASRKDRSRQQLLDAAEAAFRETGYAGTSVEAIALRAGLTRKTVYNLFAGKEDLAEQLIARGEELAETRYRARIEAGEGALGLIESLLNDSIDWCLANPDIAPLALSPRHRPGLAPPEGCPSMQRVLRDMLVLGQRQGSIRADEDAEFMTLLLLAIHAQATTSYLSGEPHERTETARILRLMIEGFRQARNG